MNLYSLLVFLSAVIYFYMGAKMIGVRPLSKLPILFSLVCFGFALWSFTITFVFSAPTRELALAWARHSVIGWGLCPGLLLHFALVLTGLEQKLSKGVLFLGLYAPGAVIIFRELRYGLTVMDVESMVYGWNTISPLNSPWYVFFSVYYIGYVLLGATLLLWWSRQTDSPRAKRQAEIVSMVLFGSVILIFLSEAGLPLLGIRHIPKLPSLFSMIWAIGMWRAIFQYRLMNASQFTDGEMLLEDLMTKLLRTLLDNSRAQRVVVLLKQEGEFFIEGEGVLGGGVFRILQNISLGVSDLPAAFILSAIRLEKSLVSNQVGKESLSAQPLLPSEWEQGSCVAIPMIARGRVIGLVYLENKQRKNSFPLEQVTSLEGLVAEVAGSLEQAVIFSSLQASHDRLAQWNTILEKTVQEKTQAMRNLLNNVSQGFLTVDSLLKVQAEYSAECVRIFGGPIAHRRIGELIFAEDLEERALFEDMLRQIVVEKDRQKKSLFLDLLAEEALIGGLNVKLEYKLIESESKEEAILLILTDKTETRRMEDFIQEENRMFDMVVRVVSNFGDFNQTVQEYEEFCQGIAMELAVAEDLERSFLSVCRQIHTFKGSFGQFGLPNAVLALHELESALGSCKKRKLDPTNLQEVLSILNEEDLRYLLEVDLAVLRGILGDSMFLKDKALLIDRESLNEVHQKIVDTLAPEDINQLLPMIKKLHWKPFKEALFSYPEYVVRVAQQLDKLVYPLVIEGGETLVDLDVYRDFARSLGHVFRNAVDHGIESPDIRLEQGKDVHGKIYCSVTEEEGGLRIEISDDGAGLDEQGLEKQLESIGASSASVEQRNMTIFQDGISLRSEASLVSGRGVGLAAVKDEVKKLQGTIGLSTRKGEGLSVVFHLPLLETLSLQRVSDQEIMQLLLQTALDVLGTEAGIPIETYELEEIHRVGELELEGMTSIMPLRGVVTGRMVFSCDLDLCSHMLDSFAMWEVKEEERLLCYDDLVSELLNTISGQFLLRIPKMSEVVNTELPIRLQSEQGRMRCSSHRILAYQKTLPQGKFLFAFVPGNEEFYVVT